MRYLKRTLRCGVVAVGVMGMGWGALGQSGGEGFEDVVRVRPVEEEGRENELIERATAERRASRVVADGRYLLGVRGRLAMLSDRRWEIYIENGADLGIESERMYLHPCTRLMEMGRIVSGRADGVGFEINGQVFLYRGENYLLPMSFEVLRVNATGDTAQESTEASREGDGLAVESTDVDSMLDALSPRERESARVVPRMGTAIQEEGAVIAPLREGTMVVSRTGRLVERSEGGWEFRIDSDMDGGAEQDPPVIVLQCAMLERMEFMVESRPSAPKLTMSGGVFVYQGENYLLPVMLVVEPMGEGNLVTAQ